MTRRSALLAYGILCFAGCAALALVWRHGVGRPERLAAGAFFSLSLIWLVSALVSDLPTKAEFRLQAILIALLAGAAGIGWLLHLFPH